MAPRSSKGGFYAVKVGRMTGVFKSWAECEAQTKGFPGSIYKKFPSFPEAESFAGVASSDASVPVPVPVPSPSTSVASTKTNKTLKPTANSKGKKRAFDAEVSDTSGWDIVYSDGACKGNGKAGSIAGVGVWWGHDDERNIAERCPGDQTNNRAELIAIMRVLETTPISKKPLLIRTDSQYSINCFRNWIQNWKSKGWKTSQGQAVKNAGLIRCISAYLDLRGRRGQKVVLEYVKGHSGDIGNDGADLMANQGATKASLPERDWASLEAKLAQELAETDFHGEKVAKVEIIGPPEGLPDSQEEPEVPKKVRRTSSQQKTTTIHQKIMVTKTVSSPASDPDSKPKTIVVHSSSQETITTIRKSVQPDSSSTTSATQETKTTNYSHIWDEPGKVPLKVSYVAPSLLSDIKPEVDFSMYADCLLPDDVDLADELSD